jgi:hypothetical protein
MSSINTESFSVQPLSWSVNALREGLLYTAIVLTPFQDTILRVPLRHLGTSFAIVPILLLVLLDLAVWLARPDRRVSVKWLCAGCYGTLLTLIYLLLFGTNWNGTNLLLKSCTLFIMTGLALYVMYRPDWGHMRYLALAVRIAFAIAIVGVLFGDLNLLGLRDVVNNPIFHQTANLDERWRGFTAEASTLALSMGSLGFLAAALSKSRIAKTLLVVLTMLLLAFGASKGAILTVALVGISVVLLSKGRRIPAVLCLILLMPVGYLAYQRFLTMSTLEALSETTTVATRGTVVLWSIDVMAHHPLGVGFGGFYPALSKYLPETVSQVNELSPIPLNFEEVVGYATSSENASTKTLLFNFIVYFGIPFLIAFLALTATLIRACVRCRRPLLLATFLFVTIGVCTYNDPLVYYNVFLVYGLCWSQHKNLTRASCYAGLPIPTRAWRPGRYVGKAVPPKPAWTPLASGSDGQAKA